jgi:hypothetical protein
MFRKFFSTSVRARLTAGLFLVLALGAAPTRDAAAEAGVLHLSCTNPASGTIWPVVVDIDHGKVDSAAATITDKWVSWGDTSRGFYDLERATGKLRFRNASSTGGYFLYYQCRAE